MEGLSSSISQIGSMYGGQSGVLCYYRVPLQLKGHFYTMLCGGVLSNREMRRSLNTCGWDVHVKIELHECLELRMSRQEEIYGKLQ